MVRLITGRRAERGRHEGISSKGREGAEAGARSICLCDTALFRGITGEEAALNCRTIGGGKVGGNAWEMETFVGSARCSWLGRRSGSGDDYFLSKITAGVAGCGKALLFLVRRSHKDRGQKKHE